jgi:hypothetical protein
MKTFLPSHVILTVACVLALAAALPAQQNIMPHIGYVFPAGARQGASIQVKVGGQYLGNVTNAYISGDGAQAVVQEFVKPLTQQQVNQLREKLKALQEKRDAAKTRPALTSEEMRTIAEIREKLALFQKRMVNPAIAETVTLKVTIATNAPPGQRELRLKTPAALSQPLVFCIGQLPEFDKPEPSLAERFQAAKAQRNAALQTAVEPVESRVTLPCVANGQILPGGVDRYKFEAVKGQRLVIAAAARELIPYLADAVPGWFQSVLSLYDTQGHELAYAGHYRFHPDPVLFYEVPKDGQYTVQIRDSIYRGREDFVYRVTMGEVPYVTGIFPLGGPAGVKTKVKLAGWNLPCDELTEDATDLAPGVYPLCARTEKCLSNHLPFEVDTLPECLALKSNHSQAKAQTVTLPVIINGRIEQPGQWDVFRFRGRAGQDIVAEVVARRLDSPLDSVIRLTDDKGRQIAFNDDCEDKGAGLQTQYADSYFRVTLPDDGDYYLYLGDAQQEGGPDYAYRLRLSPPRPDFALRLVPSSLTVRGGMSVPFVIHALRKDGFSNEISLALKDAPPGFTLSGGGVPANQDQVRLTISAPSFFGEKVCNFQVEGRAVIQDKKVVHPAIPAEDMMQAFAYRHLVSCQETEVTLVDRPQFKRVLDLLGPNPVRIPAGGTARVRVRTPGNSFTNNFELQLSDPPDGISIQSVSLADAEADIVLHCDAAKIKPGSKGNLIIDVTAKRPPAVAGKKRANQPRATVGALPAVAFEVVPP